MTTIPTTAAASVLFSISLYRLSKAYLLYPVVIFRRHVVPSIPLHRHRHRRCHFNCHREHRNNDDLHQTVDDDRVDDSNGNNGDVSISKGNPDWMIMDWTQKMKQREQPKDGIKMTQSSIDHDSIFQHRTTIMTSSSSTSLNQQQPSPVERVLIRDRIVYIKRDDLLRLQSSHVSGNKARKLFGLNELSLDEFPKVILSFGGPQSNAMVALAAIVNSKNRLYDDENHHLHHHIKNMNSSSIRTNLQQEEDMQDKNSLSLHTTRTNTGTSTPTTSIEEDLDLIQDNLSELSSFIEDDDDTLKNKKNKRYLREKNKNKKSVVLESTFLTRDKKKRPSSFSSSSSSMDHDILFTFPDETLTVIGKNQQQPQEEEEEDKKDEDNDTTSLTLSNNTKEEEPFFVKQANNKEKQFRFIYYTKKLPRYLRKQPNGNLLRALSLGMDLIELSPTEYGNMFSTDQGGTPLFPSWKIQPPIPGQSLWIPQGGACSVAIPGARLLAQEIIDYWSSHGRGLPLSVCVPGGTCTTAMLLSHEMNCILHHNNYDNNNNNNCTENMDIQVVVIPCVGDDLYAMKQMENLYHSIENSMETRYPICFPKILRPRKESGKGKASNGYYVFGEPDSSILETYLEMKEEYGVYLDLLYGAPAWTLLLQQLNPDWYGKGRVHEKGNDSDCPLNGRQIMYIHSGGLEGVSSQLTRYRHKGLVDSREIQPS